MIGMVAFTYLFVRGIEPSTEAAPVETTTTTLLAPLGDGSPITTPSTVPLDAEGQAYVDAVTGFTTDLGNLSGEMVALNEQWDARELEYADARDTLRDDINVRITQWKDRVVAATAPESRASQQEALVSAATSLDAAATEVLAGLESSDTGERRASALEAFAAAVAAFNTAADAAAAGA